MDVLGDDLFSPGVSCCVILDRPVGKLLLDGVLITHCGRSDLYLPIGPHIRMQNMWRLSVLHSDSPDFPDTGDPDICFGMPRSPNVIGNVESDHDTALLARGSCSRTPTPRDGRWEFAPMSPGLPVRKDFPVREDCGHRRPGAASMSPSSRVLGLWMPHLLFGLKL